MSIKENYSYLYILDVVGILTISLYWTILTYEVL